MTELPSKYPDDHRYIWECDCQNGDYVRAWWDESDPEFRYLWLEGGEVEKTLRKRLQRAFTLVFRPSAFSVHSNIMLTPETVDDMIEVFSSLKDTSGNPTP